MSSDPAKTIDSIFMFYPIPRPGSVNPATVRCDRGHTQPQLTGARLQESRSIHFRDLTSGFGAGVMFLERFLKGASIRIPSKAATSTPIQVVGESGGE